MRLCFLILLLTAVVFGEFCANDSDCDQSRNGFCTDMGMCGYPIMQEVRHRQKRLTPTEGNCTGCNEITPESPRWEFYIYNCMHTMPQKK